MNKKFVVVPNCSCQISTDGLVACYYGDNRSRLLKELLNNMRHVDSDVIITYSDMCRCKIIAFRGNAEQEAELILLPFSSKFSPINDSLDVLSHVTKRLCPVYNGRRLDSSFLKRDGGLRCRVFRWRASSPYRYSSFYKYERDGSVEKVNLQVRLLMLAFFGGEDLACLAIASPRHFQVRTVKGETGFRPDHLFLKKSNSLPEERSKMLVPCIYDAF